MYIKRFWVKHNNLFKCIAQIYFMFSKILIIFSIIVIISISVLLLLFYYSIFSTNAIYHGDRDVNKIALTFDDGPSNNTLKIISVLNDNNVKATFFVLGINILDNELIFKELIDSNNEIANHSYNHFRLNLYSKSKIDNEISSLDVLFKDYSITSNLFRSPYAHTSFLLDLILKEKNKKLILCDVWSYDYKQISTNDIVNNVLSNVQNGSIIIFHDSAYNVGTLNNVPEALEILIPKLKEKYELVTVSELISQN